MFPSHGVLVNIGIERWGVGGQVCCSIYTHVEVHLSYAQVLRLKTCCYAHCMSIVCNFAPKGFPCRSHEAFS